MVAPCRETAWRSWSKSTLSVMASSYYEGTGRDPDADTGGRWFGSLIFLIIQVAGNRMVVDRQKIITWSESRRYRVASRLEVRAGSMVR
jgi:hypothetical protein